jgi:hypothetical protein
LVVVGIRTISFVIFNRQIFSIIYPKNGILWIKLGSALQFICQKAPFVYATCELYKTVCMIAILFFNHKQEEISHEFISRIYTVYRIRYGTIIAIIALYTIDFSRYLRPLVLGKEKTQ